MTSSHGASFSRNHLRASSCPLLAAASQSRQSRGRRPPRRRRSKALKHLRSSASRGINSSSRSPVAATASRIARLTTRSRARSAGSSKCSDLRMSATTRWSGRRGIASCAWARLAGVVAVEISPLGAVMAVCAASEDMWTGCRVRVVVRRGFQEKRFFLRNVPSLPRRLQNVKITLPPLHAHDFPRFVHFVPRSFHRGPRVFVFQSGLLPQLVRVRQVFFCRFVPRVFSPLRQPSRLH